MKRGVVKFCREGKTGNLFVILARASGVLEFIHRYADVRKMWDKVIRCASYEDVLNVIGGYVELVRTNCDFDFDYEVMEV